MPIRPHIMQRPNAGLEAIEASRQVRATEDTIKIVGDALNKAVQMFLDDNNLSGRDPYTIGKDWLPGSAGFVGTTDIDQVITQIHEGLGVDYFGEGETGEYIDVDRLALVIHDDYTTEIAEAVAGYFEVDPSTLLGI